MKRFTTDMGSLAYQNVYDLIELQDSMRYSPSTAVKDMPIAVRNNHDNLIDHLIDVSDICDEQIVNWITSTIMQSKDLSDVEYMDDLLDGKLIKEGYIEKAVKIVRSTPGAPNI